MTTKQGEWLGMESAPRDGTQFLALVSNGWHALVRAPQNLDWPYQWWLSSDRQSYPVVDTHPDDTDWSQSYTMLLTHWMPLPTPPQGHGEK